MKWRTKKIILITPRIKKGKEFIFEGPYKLTGDYITYETASQNQKAWFINKDAVIIGANSKHERKGCKISWEFDISELSNDVVNAKLNIKTFKIVTGLHSPRKKALEAIINGNPKNGKIYINDTIISALEIRSKMLYTLSDGDLSSVGLLDKEKENDFNHYKDYGFNNIQPFDIAGYLGKLREEKADKLIVTIEVDTDVMWDIDEVSIESILVEIEEYTQAAYMLLGAAISVLFTAIFQFSLPFYNILNWVCHFIYKLLRQVWLHHLIH